MAKKDSEVIDDDGNVIAPPPPDSPVAQIVWLLEYARKRGFSIPTVQVGDTIVQVRDLRQEAQSRGGTPADLSPDSDMALVLAGDLGDR